MVKKIEEEDRTMQYYQRREFLLHTYGMPDTSKYLPYITLINPHDNYMSWVLWYNNHPLFTDKEVEACRGMLTYSRPQHSEVEQSGLKSRQTGSSVATFLTPLYFPSSGRRVGKCYTLERRPRGGEMIKISGDWELKDNIGESGNSEERSQALRREWALREWQQ